MAKRTRRATNGHGGLIRMYRRVDVQEYDPDMDKVCSVFAKEGLTASQAATFSGVGSATIRKWELHETRRPQHLTMLAGLRGIGYAFKIEKVEDMNYAAELPKAKAWIKARDAERRKQRKTKPKRRAK